MFKHLDPTGQLIIFILILMVIIGIWIQRKASKGKYSQKVQKPRQFKTFFTKVTMILTIFIGILAAIGAMTGEMEMAIVFSVIFIILAVLAYFMRLKLDTTYQETDEYFILRNEQEETKVFYEDISYWRWSFDERITVVDGTKPEEEKVLIRLDYFHPEILLRTLAEMTFDDQFQRQDDDDYTHDPMKKKEMVQFLHWKGYKYLVKDEYTEETGELEGSHWPEQTNPR